MSIRSGYSVKSLITGLSLILFQSCAPVFVQPPSPPLVPQEIAYIISNISDQEKQVHSFFSTARLIYNKDGSESESNILAIASKNPFRIKIEITHPWGRPLLHVLINRSRIQVLSFPEKRYYTGQLGDPGSSKFFPGRLAPDKVWAFLRGYPILLKHKRFLSIKGDQVVFFNGNDEVIQVIDLYPDSDNPRLISFPEEGIRMLFSDFENDNDIYYARKTKLDDLKDKTTLTFKLKQIAFNKSVPETIFCLKIPAGFKKFPLNGELNE